MIIEFKDKTFARITDMQYQNLKRVLVNPNAPRFVEIGGELFETYKIRSVVSDDTGNSYIRQAEREVYRQEGSWKCQQGNWHPKQYKDCSCFDPRYALMHASDPSPVLVKDCRPLLKDKNI